MRSCFFYPFICSFDRSLIHPVLFSLFVCSFVLALEFLYSFVRSFVRLFPFLAYVLTGANNAGVYIFMFKNSDILLYKGKYVTYDIDTRRPAGKKVTRVVHSGGLSADAKQAVRDKKVKIGDGEVLLDVELDALLAAMTVEELEAWLDDEANLAKLSRFGFYLTGMADKFLGPVIAVKRELKHDLTRGVRMNQILRKPDGSQPTKDELCGKEAGAIVVAGGVHSKHLLNERFGYGKGFGTKNKVVQSKRGIFSGANE